MGADFNVHKLQCQVISRVPCSSTPWTVAPLRFLSVHRTSRQECWGGLSLLGISHPKDHACVSFGLCTGSQTQRRSGKAGWEGKCPGCNDVRRHQSKASRESAWQHGVLTVSYRLTPTTRARPLMCSGSFTLADRPGTTESDIL